MEINGYKKLITKSSNSLLKIFKNLSRSKQAKFLLIIIKADFNSRIFKNTDLKKKTPKKKKISKSKNSIPNRVRDIQARLLIFHVHTT